MPDRGNMFLLVGSLVFFLSFRVSHQYSSGAPSSYCVSMFPGHGYTPQTSISPYTVQVSATTYNSEDSITVTVSGGDFKGVLLVAKDNSGNGVGSFSISDTNFQTIQCMTGGGGFTHKASTLKSGLIATWTAPNVTIGDIKIFATFVLNYATIWVNVTSPTITSTGTAASTVWMNVTSPTITSTGTAAATPAPPAPGIIQFDDQCGVSKGCFSDCQNNKCGFLVTWRDTGSSIEFELVGRGTGSGDSWIAIGFSRDSRMGEDSVIECVSNGGSLQVQQSYNNQGYSNGPVTNATLGLTNPAGEYKDEIIRCTVSRQTRGLSDSRLFDLDVDWYILYAEGPAGTGFTKYQHTKIPSVSSVVADLQSFDVIGGQTNKYILVKVHGSLMIISWVMFTGIGIIAARYFKNVWASRTLFQQKIWFQIHRSCMVAAISTSVTGFIIIFIEAEGYSNIPKREGYDHLQAHPVLGIIITILVIINPIMALFRPHPGTKNRPVFNWAHWAVGMTAYILSAICICFGFQLGKAGTPDYAIYIMIGYVVYVVLMDIALEVMGYYHKRKQAGVDSAVEMKQTNGAEYQNTQTGANHKVEKQDKMRESIVKKRLLFVHMTVTISFTVALVVIVVLE